MNTKPAMRIFLAALFALSTLTVRANSESDGESTAKMLHLLNQLDQLDQMDLFDLLMEARDEVHARNFSKAEKLLQEAKMYVHSPDDKDRVNDVYRALEEEQEEVARERRIAEARRQEELRQARQAAERRRQQQLAQQAAAQRKKKKGLVALAAGIGAAAAGMDAGMSADMATDFGVSLGQDIYEGGAANHTQAFKEKYDLNEPPSYSSEPVATTTRSSSASASTSGASQSAPSSYGSGSGSGSSYGISGGSAPSSSQPSGGMAIVNQFMAEQGLEASDIDLQAIQEQGMQHMKSRGLKSRRLEGYDQSHVEGHAQYYFMSAEAGYIRYMDTFNDPAATQSQIDQAYNDHVKASELAIKFDERTRNSGTAFSN